MPKIATATLRSVSPYSQSKAHDTEHLDREGPDDFDRRTWREHLHYDQEGNVFIPPSVWKNSLDDAASYLGMKVKGQGNSRYSKHFSGGVQVAQPSFLGVKKDAVPGERLNLAAHGKRGEGQRVWRTYPVIHSWACEVEYQILDDVITEQIFEEHLIAAGKFIGIGRFRPRNRGYYGRFEVVKVKWGSIG